MNTMEPADTIFDEKEEMIPPTEQPKAPKAQKEKKKKKEEKEEKEEKEVCTVCANHYTPVIRRQIECKFCKKSTCTKCIEQYLLGRHEDAHCLHCRVNYSDAVLHDICTKTYLNQVYFKHRQEVLINRERANLPPLQEEALQIKRRQAINTEISAVQKLKRRLKQNKSRISFEIVQIRLEYAVLAEQLRLAQHNGNAEQITAANQLVTENVRTLLEKEEEERRCRNELQECAARRTELYRQYHQTWRRRPADDADGNQGDEKEEKKKFIRRCVRPECQGFLSQAWKCGLCEWYSCSKCYSVRGPNHDSPHECKKEDVETAEMIRKDSKPCPKCGEFIFRSSGCSQIWCIVCHTPWDWNTGKIVVSGAIHNPHYYEWLQRNNGSVPRNPADVPCGGYVHPWQLRKLQAGIPWNLRHAWTEFHRFCIETQDHTGNTYRTHLDQDSLHRIHIRFLNGEYNEARWGQLLAIHEKKRKRDSEIQEVFAAFRMISVEMIHRIQHYRDETVDSFSIVPLPRAIQIMTEWVEEMEGLFRMMNDSFRRIGLAYSYAVPYLTKEEVTNMMTEEKNIRFVLRTRKWHELEAKRRSASKKGKNVLQVEEEEEQEEHFEEERFEEEDEKEVD